MSPHPSPPLDQPLYGATFGQAVSRFFRKYATFSGRASRSEYWWWALATFIVYVVVGGVSLALGVATGELNTTLDGFYLGPAATVGVVILALWFVATLVPQLAVGVRRLHDANLSGWLILLRLVPSIGEIAVFIMTLLPSNPAGARFDRDSAQVAGAHAAPRP